MKKYFSIKYIKENIQIIIVFIVSAVLRISNLGYSDFQGDEIKALYYPNSGQSFFEFILDQRKGPVQFFITYILKFIDPLYENQFLLRLPFALAGIFAVIFFYKFVKLHFGDKVAFYSSLFFATNGLFIAFSRIVQYQSFVIFFAIVSLYFLSLANKNEKYKISGIYLGLIFWAFSILSHYDGVLVFSFVFYLLFRWLKDAKLEKDVKIRTIIISGILSVGLLVFFYVPFLKSINSATSDYWLHRITGASSGKISSSKYLFKIYQPLFAFGSYVVLSVLGAVFILLGFFSSFILKVKNLPQFIKTFFSHSTEIMQSIKKDKLRIICFFLWIGVSVFFFEKYVYISGTHIYNYFIPTFILLGFGIVSIESAIFKVFEYQLVRIFNFLGIFTIFVFLIAQSFVIFVDNRKEYPWEKERFLIWDFTKPDENYHLSLFGFPYYRDWEGIRNFAKSHPELQAYSSNEKKPLSGYYLDLDRNYEKSGLYVYIKNPQSFIEQISDDKAAYWVGRHSPVFTLTAHGNDKVRVYMMEPGTLEEIIQKGF